MRIKTNQAKQVDLPRSSLARNTQMNANVYSDRGATVPAPTLDVYNFFHKHANPPNLVAFPKIYLGTIWRSKCLSIKFDVTMATTF